ncbi:MAG: regulatory protein RecX [Bdellovibrionales bacterium]|nr:regulatory protein RecX [Bdellovibrionales bacterium]
MAFWRSKRKPSDEPPEEDPRAFLLRTLSCRDYSRSQLEEKLRERGHAPDRIAAAIEELQEAGFFKADAYAEARMRAFIHKGYGPRWIQSKLRSEKVAVTKEMIDAAYDHLGLSEDEQIRELVRKQMKSSTLRKQLQSDEREARNKWTKRLITRGFAPHAIARAIAAALSVNSQRE